MFDEESLKKVSPARRERYFNRDGHRFITEDASYAVSGYLLNEQPEMRCFAIFDEAAMLEAWCSVLDSKGYRG